MYNWYNWYLHVVSGDIEITKKFNDIKCRYDRPFTLECQARSEIGKKLTFTWKLEKGEGNHNVYMYMYNPCTCTCTHYRVNIS